MPEAGDNGMNPTYDAILFPSDYRPPRLVELMATAITSQISHPSPPYRCGKVPHPEVYMDYIVEGLGHQAWKFHVVEALEGMDSKLSSPYIIFYATLSREGVPFPVNECIREIQGAYYNEAAAWRGTIVVAKYRDSNYSSMTDASMADFPIVKNYLMHQPAP